MFYFELMKKELKRFIFKFYLQKLYHLYGFTKRS